MGRLSWEVDAMVWIFVAAAVLVVLAVLGYLEWRSWRKAGSDKLLTAHLDAQAGTALTGGHDVDADRRRT